MLQQDELTKNYGIMRDALDKQATMLRLDLPEVRTMHSEVSANIMLAVRHLEDARMRLGKAIQYAGDGVSSYNKPRG